MVPEGKAKRRIALPTSTRQRGSCAKDEVGRRDPAQGNGGQGRNRTTDTRIFRLSALRSPRFEIRRPGRAYTRENVRLNWLRAEKRACRHAVRFGPEAC